jgi:hypothetical protein
MRRGIGVCGKDLPMRRLPVALLLLFLAGCAGTQSPPAGTARAFFTAPDLIEVVTTDYQPPRQIALVGPLGELDAVQIDTTENAGAAYPSGGTALSFGFGGGGSSSFAGIGLGFPLIGSGVAPAGPVIARGYIRLPDSAHYADTWQHTTVRINFGIPPAERTVTIPAPPPPAS